MSPKRQPKFDDVLCYPKVGEPEVWAHQGLAERDRA